MKIAVIGAGPCGLPVCKTLKEFGLEFECLEASDRLGGIWNVGIGGNAYRSLQTNTSTRAMAFSDFPFAKGASMHPNAAEMIEYFQAYAAHFEIRQHIKFNSSVVNIEPTGDGNWLLELENGETTEYSKVIVATGKYSKPYLPKPQGHQEFSGEVLHSSEYLDIKSPIDLRGKRVLVVGLGSSAAEIACELANKESPLGSASKVMLSARSGRWVIPKVVDGVPADAAAPTASEELHLLLRILPSWFGRWLVRRIMGRVFRQRFDSLQSSLSVKLPEPRIDPWADRPTLSSNFIPSLRAGLIELKGDIERLESSSVFFKDGSQEDVDIILWATGFEIDIPFIKQSVLGGPCEGLRLYQRIAHPTQDGLFFVGYCPVMCSMWPLAEQQSRWLARLLTGAFKLPQPSVLKKKAILLNKSLPVLCAFYVNELRRQAKGFGGR